MVVIQYGVFLRVDEAVCLELFVGLFVEVPCGGEAIGFVKIVVFDAVDECVFVFGFMELLVEGCALARGVGLAHFPFEGGVF